MGSLHPNADFRGARGSNAGDQFHEFWALEQILELLRPGTALRAVSVEGVASQTPAGTGDGPKWDGVDCALYFGEPSIEHADVVEFVQLKYSAANPETVWSLARLTANNAKKGNNSVIRRMADDFTDARARMKPGAQLKIRLVSNQGLSHELKQLLSARWTGNLNASRLDKQVVKNLERLRKAAGLSEEDLAAFIECLDFGQTGQGSRFATKARVFATFAVALGNDVSSEVRELQSRVRELMLPERAEEIITEKDLLLWFGLSGREGLFPSPADIRLPANRIPRAAAAQAAELLRRGERLLLVHGEGGCGKTTLLHEIADHMPEGSVTIFFDCFGGGRYIYSDDKRHRPENAFLQLTNELALACKLPLFIPRNFKHPAGIRFFLAKVRTAGDALQQSSPGALLIINIDAADNAVTAAFSAEPVERPFVFDVGEANLRNLPANVRFVVSARTSRKDSLRLPAGTKEVTCPPFSRDETKGHLESRFREVSDALVEQFHTLSNQNPRVQAYALATSAGIPDQAIEALRPGGKGLADILEASFDVALQKLGQPRLFGKFVAALAHLPAPAAVSAIAGVTGAYQSIVRDLVLDLAPGLRLQEETVTIADEDFDTFIKDRAAPDRDTVHGEIASYFAANYSDDAYSSCHLADALIAAGRAHEILQAIERDPQAAAIRDPILRRQVQVRRLKLSLAACRHAGSMIDVLKTVLISAEATRDDSTLTEVLARELDLSAEFAGPSLRRTILLDPDRVQEHGSFLAQDAVRAIRAGDRVTAREQTHFYFAWLKQRDRVPDAQLEHWVANERDISAWVETILELEGAAAALNRLLAWRPRSLALRIADILVPHLIASGKEDRLHTILGETSIPRPWDLLVRIPLAMAGEPVDADAIGRSLRQIRTRFIPQINALNSYSLEDAWPSKLLDTFITACELGYLLGVDKATVAGAIGRVVDALQGKPPRHLHRFEFHRLDGLMRCWFLNAAVAGNTSAEAQDFLEYVKSLVPPRRAPDQTNRKGTKERQPQERVRQEEEEKRRGRTIRALFPVYAARIDILVTAARGEQITGKQLDAIGGISEHFYDFDYDHDSLYLRQTAARSVSRLLIVPSIPASELIARASVLAEGRFSDPFVTRKNSLWMALSLRAAEASHVVELATAAATSIKMQRAAASDKVEALIRLSRLTLPVSRRDAALFFNDAVDIAKEIDEEAIDQIDFLSAVAECADIPDPGERRRIAQDVSAFASEASARLSAGDAFRWRSAVTALTVLDGPMALAAICRWADDGTIGLETTVNAFLHTALDRNTINTEVAQGLTLLLTRLDDDVHKKLVSCATTSTTNGKALLEELSQDVLLLNPQGIRRDLGLAIAGNEPADTAPDGPWLACLKEAVAFLNKQDFAAKPKTEPSSHVSRIRAAANEESPKSFEFDPQGRTFTTSAAIAEVLEQASESGLRYSDRDILRKMRAASSQPRDRVAFLRALMDCHVDALWFGSRFEILSETLNLWKGTRSVNEWRKGALPQAIVSQFCEAARWLKEGVSALPKLLELAGLEGTDRLKVLIEGISSFGDSLGSRTLFGIAELMARCLAPKEAGTILDWYARRVRSRLPADGPPAIPLKDVPASMAEAVGRFLFALMSDIDTRIRWKAVHALRRMARLQSSEVVKATVDQLARTQDAAYRDPAAPFYFLAARFWLLIATYRISAENPQMLASFKDVLLDVATSTELPHAAIREYAKRTIAELSRAKTLSLAPEEQARLAVVNAPAKGAIPRGKRYLSFDHGSSNGSRFKFNELDTIRHWYTEILWIFPTVTQEEVLALAEHWIIDKWGADAEANWWDKEPRRSRYDERRFGLYSSSGGELSVLERYGTHLEWNAMHCFVGELLLTHPISDETGYGSFEYWLSKSLPTEPPQWLSDLRGPTPLERRFWAEDPRTDNGWIRKVRQEEFRHELSSTPPHPGWIVVAGHHTCHFPTREADVHISSALVSPETAAALARALQTATNPRDFHIPDEDDDLELDHPPYQLQGWLAANSREEGFDARDPLRYEVHTIRKMPGQEVTKALGLTAQIGMHRTWIGRDSKTPAFVYEAWCDEPAPEEEYSRRIQSEGWRLWANPDELNFFLVNKGMDLICKVQIDRRLRSEYSRSYETDAKKSKNHKIFLLRAGGSLEHAGGRFGAWQGVGTRTQARAQRGHARPLDGASHRRTDSRSRGGK